MRYGLKKDTIEKINAVFEVHENVETVLIYGSRAMGNYKKGSDIDLTLLGENMRLKQLNRIHNELDELLLPYIFDLSIYDQIANPDLLDHIERVGKIFYQK